MVDTLSDETLKQIAESNTRCYTYEGRLMAQELIARRAKERETPALPDIYGSLFP